MKDHLPFKADAPFTVTCWSRLRSGWSTPVIYPQVRLHVGGYNIHSDNVFEGTIRNSLKEIHAMLENENGELGQE